MPRRVGLSFEDLVRFIRGVDAERAAQAGRAVNVSLTLHNWLIGGSIAEYELRGNDRAAHGGKLLDFLAADLDRLAVTNSNRRQPHRRTFFPGGVSVDGESVGTPSPQSGHRYWRVMVRRIEGPSVAEVPLAGEGMLAHNTPRKLEDFAWGVPPERP